MGLLRVRHDWVTSLSLFTFMHWRRKWQPTTIFLPEESQGQRSLVGCCLCGRTDLDTTEATAAAAIKYYFTLLFRFCLTWLLGTLSADSCIPLSCLHLFVYVSVCAHVRVGMYLCFKCLFNFWCYKDCKLILHMPCPQCIQSRILGYFCWRMELKLKIRV